MLLRAFGHMHCSLNPVIYGYLAVKMFQRRRELQHTAIRRRKMQQVSNVIYYAKPENTVLGFKIFIELEVFWVTIIGKVLR